MTRTKINRRIVGERIDWVDRMVVEISVRVLSADESALLKVLAGYRNRLVHFYHEITTEELYDIGKNQLDDILLIKDALLEWLKTNPEKLNETL